MNEILDAIRQFWAAIPVEARVCLLAWLCSAGATQWFKFQLPLTWSPLLRGTLVRLVAFGVGAGVVLLLIKGALAYVLAAIVGFWSPIAYPLLVIIIEDRFPFLADLMSGDIRGVLKGDVKTAPGVAPRIPMPSSAPPRAEP